MATDLQRLEDWLSPLLAKLQPGERQKLAREIASQVRKTNAQNIRNQVGPDGGKWEKRKRTRAPTPPMRYVYKKRDGSIRELEMSSYRNDGDRITGYDKEEGGLRTMLKSGMLRELSPLHRTSATVQRKRAELMLTGLTQSRFLRANGTPDAAVVQFIGQAERIARIHHFGLRDRVTPGGVEYKYPERPLLGINEKQQGQIRDLILHHLAATS